MASIRQNINYIFDTLCNAGDNPDARKNIKPATPLCSEINFFKRLKFRQGEYINFFNGLMFIHFQEVEKTSSGEEVITDYYAVKGLNTSEFQSEIFESFFSIHDITEATFLFLSPLLKLKIKEGMSSTELTYDLLYQQDDKIYEGHSLTELISYFEPISIFRLEDISTKFNESYQSCAYYILSSCEKLITLPLTTITVEKLKRLFIVNAKIPKDNIFLSLTSSHLKHCFLELYRCIEWLYVIPRSRKLKGAIEYSKPAYELAIHCIDELSWRRKEEDSLAKIIADILKTNEELSFKLLGCKLFREIPPDSESIAKHLYSFRNQFVHQFEAKKEKSVILEDLAEAVDLISDIIIHAYELYDSDIIAWQEPSVIVQ